jgi:hypothetical protein
MNNQTKQRGRPPGAKNKPKVLNVGQQPNDPQTQKTFASALQSKNMGVDKIILNVNGGNSELVTNKNSILKYSLKQPIQLEVGDTITCINAFVEEKGLAENTISFEEDIEAEMRFMYYKQGDLGDELIDQADLGFASYPKYFPDAFVNSTNNRTNLVKNYLPKGSSEDILYEDLVGDVGPNMTFDGIGFGEKSVNNDNQNLTTGANGNYYYLMETVKYKKKLPSTGTTREFTEIQPSGANDQFYMRPCFGTKTIKVKAGNYSVDSLANIISAQLNGSLGADGNEFSDSLLDKLYNPNGINKGNLLNTYPYFKDIDSVTDQDQSDIIGNCGEESNFERKLDGFIKQMNLSDQSYYNCWAYQNLFTGYNFSGFISPATERLETGKQFPNTLTAFGPTANFTLGGGTYPPVLAQMFVNSSGYSDGKSNVHFYINKKAIDILYNTKDKWYNLPNLKTNGESVDNLFFPPTAMEVFYNVVDFGRGYIPKITTNAVINPPINSGIRYVQIEHSLTYQSLFPIKAYQYPGDDSLEPQQSVYAGTSVAQLSFGDAVSNRFALSNLHEFYKLPNLTADGSATTGYGGQQATKFNNPFYNDQAGGGATSNKAFPENNNASCVYPIDSSSGVAINNFDFGLVKNTQIYKDLVAEIQSIDGDTASLQEVLYKEKLVFELFSKPFDQFFATQSEAEAQWSKSLWSRLGFTYNQLGNVSQNLETIIAQGSQSREETKQFGIITHNAFDFSKIVSSDGLGIGNPVTKNGTPMQNYRLQSYFNGKSLPNNLGVSGNYIHLLGDSKPINAEELPSLNNGKSYLLIESDLVKPNFKDNKANLGNLLAVMSKENATNDTIFGADPIDFTVTEPRLLTDITIYIKNPDGTLAADDVVGPNNGFLIQIAKPIPVQKLPTVEI